MKKELIRKHASILLGGLLHSLKCTAAVALLAGAVVLFCCVPIESGYLAVGKFVAALLAIGISAALFYSCGKDMLHGKFSK